MKLDKWKENTSQNIQNRNIGIDYFRAFLMVLVVWHHATLAYSMTGSGVLIHDNSRFIGFDLLALYNDMFFMFAFFFISGFFSYPSLLKKGSINFIKERFIRLMLPFAVVTLLVNPIAHYFSFANKNKADVSIDGCIQFFIHTFGKVEANHLWFLWVLFLFSLILVVYHKISKSDKGTGKSIWKQYICTNLWIFMLAVIGLGILCYLPIQAITQDGFIQVMKPFDMQISRIMLYFLYFMLGNVIGTYGIEKSFLASESIQKKWWIFLVISVLITIGNIVVHIVSQTSKLPYQKNIWTGIDHSMVVIISLFATLGFINFFLRYCKEENPMMNAFAKEGMGIYIIHYTIVSVLQYYFYFLTLSAVVKGILVTGIALFASFVLILGLKKVPILGIVFGRPFHPKYEKRVIYLTVIVLLLLIFL